MGWIRGLVMLLFIIGVTGAPGESGRAEETAISCEVHLGSCKGTLGGQPVELEILPRPVRVMVELTYRLTLSGLGLAEGQNPHVDLGMPGMKMGPNRVELKPVSPGTYEGKGILVRCPSGKKAWQAALTVPGQGVVAFVFNVHD